MFITTLITLFGLLCCHLVTENQMINPVKLQTVGRTPLAGSRTTVGGREVKGKDEVKIRRLLIDYDDCNDVY